MDDFNKLHKNEIEFAHRLKVIQMKVGQSWQIIFGSIAGVKDLGVGHESGLDLMSDSAFRHGKMVMELKNSWNTDNSSSRAQNLRKLTKFASSNPDYQPIYAFVNTKKSSGEDKFITFENHQVRILSGKKLLRYVLGKNYKKTVACLKETIPKFLKQ